jgi:DNA-binding NarL/FixJ family response regulator
MAANPIRVLCIDDHDVVREGISLILTLQSDMRVIGGAGSGEEGIALFRQHRPDITLMDLQLPGISGLEAIRIIRGEYPDARIIVLTMYTGDKDVHSALQAGAITYVSKGTASDELLKVIREVHGGGRPISREVAARLAESVSGGSLTAREVEVMRLLAKGKRNKEIGEELNIANDTVQAHLRSILSKLNVTGRSAAVAVALRRGIIHLE